MSVQRHFLRWQPERFGLIYQQTFVESYCEVAFAKLYTAKNPITTADSPNDKVLPLFATQGLAIMRVLTDRETEYCFKPEQHDYQIYLAVNDIDHTTTKVKSPQTNDICNTSIKRFYSSFMRLLSERNRMNLSMHYKNIWTSGWNTKTMSELIMEKSVAAEHCWKHYMMANESWMKRS